MGTNYYVRVEACECCGRADAYHLCKSLISFRGYVGSPRDLPPFGEVRSWQGWKRVLATPGTTVWDEYGVQHDTAEFIARVEATPESARGRQHRWMSVHFPGDGTEWLDPDGFSFSSSEFT